MWWDGKQEVEEESFASSTYSYITSTSLPWSSQNISLPILCAIIPLLLSIHPYLLPSFLIAIFCDSWEGSQWRLFDISSHTGFVLPSCPAILVDGCRWKLCKTAKGSVKGIWRKVWMKAAMQHWRLHDFHEHNSNGWLSSLKVKTICDLFYLRNHVLLRYELATPIHLWRKTCYVHSPSNIRLRPSLLWHPNSRILSSLEYLAHWSLPDPWWRFFTQTFLWICPPVSSVNCKTSLCIYAILFPMSSAIIG